MVNFEIKHKVHVCAPSNNAVDEILLRMVKSGTDLNLLRVGAKTYKAPDELL